MKNILIIVSCLAMTFSISCKSKDSDLLPIRLGEFSKESAGKQTFKLSVKNFFPHYWRLSLFFDQADEKNYSDVRISVKVINTGSLRVSTWQVSGSGPLDTKTIVINPGMSKIVYEGTVAEFVGLDPIRRQPYLGIWTEQNLELLQCEIEVEMIGAGKLSKKLIFGLSRTEPSF
jgi:hypothetical protein